MNEETKSQICMHCPYDCDECPHKELNLKELEEMVNSLDDMDNAVEDDSQGRFNELSSDMISTLVHNMVKMHKRLENLEITVYSRM